MLSVVSGRVDPSRHLVMALSADHPRESRAFAPVKILLGTRASVLGVRTGQTAVDLRFARA